MTLTAGEVYAPPARGDDGTWLPLSSTRHGRLFRKHVLSHGELIHPKTGEVVVIDAAFVAGLRENFARRLTGPVPLQLADSLNRHNEDPDLTVGEVVGIEDDGTKVHVLLDVRRRAGDLGVTLLGCSAAFHPDYADLATLQRVGPVLRHVLITNRPYLPDLDEYEELPTVELSVPNPSQPTGRREWSDEAVTAFTRALRRQRLSKSVSTRPASSVLALTAQAGADHHIARLTALASELGLAGPDTRAAHRNLPSLGR